MVKWMHPQQRHRGDALGSAFDLYSQSHTIRLPGERKLFRQKSTIAVRAFKLQSGLVVALEMDVAAAHLIEYGVISN